MREKRDVGAGCESVASEGGEGQEQEDEVEDERWRGRMEMGVAYVSQFRRSERTRALANRPGFFLPPFSLLLFLISLYNRPAGLVNNDQ